MSQIVPASFDPFATHPFTNNSASLPQPPFPSQYPRHIPSSYNGLHAYGSQHPASQQQQMQQYPSGSYASPMPMHAPQPQRGVPFPGGGGAQAHAQQRKHVFETFKLERSSPDLKDVLAKKAGSGSGTSSPAKFPARK